MSRGSQDLRRVPEDHPTIQAAIDASLYGDTVVIGPGLYVENIEMQQGVDLKGVGWPPPEIRATSDLWHDAVITTAPHCSIHGLIISSGYYGVRGRYGPFEVRSCVITGNTYRAVDAVGSDSADRVVNCTIVDNSGTGAYLGEPSAGNVVINSIVYGNGGRDVWGGVTRFSCLQDEICDGVGENNIYPDPMFVNPAGGDYRLLPNSPCIDAGDNGAVQGDERDILGKPRIMLGERVRWWTWGRTSTGSFRRHCRLPLRISKSPGRARPVEPILFSTLLTWRPGNSPTTTSSRQET